MTAKILLEEAKKLLQAAGVESPELEMPRDPSLGEVSCVSPFSIAKATGEPPGEVAQRVASRIKLLEDGFLNRVEPHPSGYINFQTDWHKYGPAVIETVLGDERLYGRTDFGTGKSVFLEHTNVNPNKALHVGHARNVCIGDTIARILRFSGHRVIIANYVDDSGAQMADLLLGFLRLNYPMEPPNGMRFDEYCGDKVYVEVNKRLESSPQLQKEKREITKQIEEGSSKTAQLNREVSERVLADQLQTCWRLGASYNIMNMETDILRFKLWDRAFNKLVETGSAFKVETGEKAGCWVADLSKHPVLSKEGDEVLVKSDGTTTYVARDIAYAAWKLGFFDIDFTYSNYTQNPDGSTVWITDERGEEKLPLGKMDRAISVIDVRQSRPQKVIKHSLPALGVDPETYMHFAYEVVSLGARDAERLGKPVNEETFVHMKGREGLYVKVDDVLDMLESRIGDETRQRHPEWSAQKIEKNSQNVASAALRYSLTRVDVDRIMVFDSDEAMRLDGDTAPYLLYSYARACRILEKAGVAPKPANSPQEPTPYEKELMRRISFFPVLVEDVGRSLLMKKLCGYAYQLAVSFSNFYENCRVISEDQETMQFRLGLVAAFTQTMNNALNLLGITPVREM